MDSVEGELRWLIGKVIIEGMAAKSRSEFIEAMTLVRAPANLLEQVTQVYTDDQVELFAQLARKAAELLYTSGTSEAQQVNSRVDEMLAYLQQLPVADAEPVLEVSTPQS